jgi:hypothetical protein
MAQAQNADGNAGGRKCREFWRASCLNIMRGARKMLQNREHGLEVWITALFDWLAAVPDFLYSGDCNLQVKPSQAM